MPSTCDAGNLCPSERVVGLADIAARLGAQRQAHAVHVPGPRAQGMHQAGRHGTNNTRILRRLTGQLISSATKALSQKVLRVEIELKPFSSVVIL